MPLRQAHRLERIATALASGRPLCLSRFAATAALVPAPGTCEPLGGRWLPADNGSPECFEPAWLAITAALRRLLADATTASALGARGRAHALAELCADAPAPARAHRCAPEADRPAVVLEAPLFEVSSSSELTIETARALVRRGNVELWLRPRVPFRGGVELLHERAPELVAHLCREVRAADLWLSAGWPPRADRPDAGCFALRFDYEYGSVPVELTPVLTQEADLVVVHSTHVLRTMTAAGRKVDELVLLPHGVDGEVFHEHAPPLAEVVARKGRLPAVLFAGGLVWRKGFDLYLRALLQAAAEGARFLAVVKAVGTDQHYAGFAMHELARKFAATPGAPPLLLIGRDLSRGEMAGLYRACDLLLHPYRGEGFGLPVLEARACGLPVMVTAHGSTDDFAAGGGVVKIPSAPRPVDLPAVHVSQPWVLEPDPDATAQLLVQALANMPRLQAEARSAAHAVRSTFTWDAAAEGIERLANEAMARRQGARPRALVPLG